MIWCMLLCYLHAKSFNSVVSVSPTLDLPGCMEVSKASHLPSCTLIKMWKALKLVNLCNNFPSISCIVTVYYFSKNFFVVEKFSIWPKFRSVRLRQYNIFFLTLFPSNSLVQFLSGTYFTYLYCHNKWLST